MMKDVIATTTAGMTSIAGASLAGSITVATVPVTVTSVASAGGIAGWLGFTTTVTTVVAAPITLPVSGVIAAGALLGCGVYGAYRFCKSLECKKLLEEIKLALKNKFGSEGLSIIWSEISKIVEIEMLKVIYEAIETAITPEELRQVYAT